MIFQIENNIEILEKYQERLWVLALMSIEKHVSQKTKFDKFA